MIEKCQGLEKIFFKGFNSFSNEYIYYGKHLYDTDYSDKTCVYQKFDSTFISQIKEISKELASKFYILS